MQVTAPKTSSAYTRGESYSRLGKELGLATGASVFLGLGTLFTAQVLGIYV